ncbi:MAG: sigma 54-interacting transcriptional regulator [Planctomycetales bacterium]|nr:sigma 54-interacting transcriptional regulator [Planctomycetales bacterium]
MDDPDPLTISDQYRSQAVTFETLRTRNRGMLECLRLARESAPHDIPVLILGENGTGKNLIAQAIHTASARAGKSFVSVNCSAIPETLLESELFGHERGAFTSADRERRGKFEMADGGTLFLDEIGDLAPPAQAKILRVVEYGQFERVGGERTLAADVRLLCATNQDLSAAIAAGRFRQDLYYRLRGVLLRVPPLRERPEDLEDLASHFLAEAARKFGRPAKTLAPDALGSLRAYPWPGNVRELKSVLSAAVLAFAEERIVADSRFLGLFGDGRPLPASPASAGPAPMADVAPLGEVLTLREMEKRHIEAVLRATRGNKAHASRLLDISRPTLDRKIGEYGIQVPKKEDPGP